MCRERQYIVEDSHDWHVIQLNAHLREIKVYKLLMGDDDLALGEALLFSLDSSDRQASSYVVCWLGTGWRVSPRRPCRSGERAR